MRDAAIELEKLREENASLREELKQADNYQRLMREQLNALHNLLAERTSA